MKTKIKICGLRREQDIEVVNHLKPDYIGFVFALGKRQVTLKRAAALRAVLNPDILTVGVFVNPAEADVTTLCRDKVIDIIQLHGDEDETFIARLKKITGVPVIKSIPVGNDLPALPSAADFLLFDTASPARGGTGKAFDWSLLTGFREKSYFLAGGLHAENVEATLRLLTPYAVDVSSGVETDGWKDAGKIEAFIRCVRKSEFQMKRRTE